jgi:aminoglycoside/choline kinase family phosphotransferase
MRAASRSGSKALTDTLYRARAQLGKLRAGNAFGSTLAGMHADGVDLSNALERLYGTVDESSFRITKLKGDASTRSYYRVEARSSALAHDAPRTLIAMRLPENPLGSDERSGAERATELPFVDVQRMLHKRALPVPHIYVDDTAGRVLLLEDLGDETFEQRLLGTPRSGWQQPYAQAVDLLARMHDACAHGAPAESIAFRRRFERELLRWELDHFREWGLEALVGPLPPNDRGALDAAFDALADEVAGLEAGFVHRDYQSRNLMWADGERLTVIDFQDALQGPLVYDLVALLCDSYVDLDPALQDAMITRYAQAARRDVAALRRAFWRVAAQRKLKDAGRFVFIDRVRKNPDFLRWYPQSLVYAGRALRTSGYLELSALIERHLPGFPDHTPVPAATSSR